LLALGLGASLSLIAAQPPGLPPGPPPSGPPPAFVLPAPTLPTKPSPPSAPSTPPATPPANTAEKEPLPLDQPLAWMLEARRNYTAVKDYTCTLIKTERVNRVLQDEHIIKFSCKAQPFCVYMKWQAPGKFAGQEAAYATGRNGGNMRVRKKGIVGKLTDFVSIAPTDHRVMEHSRHTILEAGIGNLIEQCLASMQVERQLNKTVVRTAEFKYDGRVCIRVEMIRPQRAEPYYCCRSVLYMDKASKLPIRMENYDWPTPGSPPGGELLERFSYVDLSFNDGLPEEFFMK